MGQENLSEIISLCMSVDITAAWIYARLSRVSPSPELSRFWLDMAREETRHVEWWKKIRSYAGLGLLPQIFTEPAAILSELRKIRDNANALFGEYDTRPNPLAMFNMAYRMEFFLLHPAFSAWFHFMGHVLPDYNPKDDYEAHIGKFIDAVHRHGETSPALELMGETLGRLWKQNGEAARQSMSDPLTGALTRSAMMNVLKPMMHLAGRSERRVGFLVVDVDSLKDINAARGFDEGDRVLRTVAGAIRDTVRASDLVCRYGEDEFCIFLYGVARDTMSAIAMKIRDEILSVLATSDVTVSIGGASDRLAVDVDPFTRATELLRRADSELDRAKRSGRGKVLVFEPTEQADE